MSTAASKRFDDYIKRIGKNISISPIVTNLNMVRANHTAPPLAPANMLSSPSIQLQINTDYLHDRQTWRPNNVVVLTEQAMEDIRSAKDDEFLDWLEENIQHNYCVFESCHEDADCIFIFEEVTDAMGFKLRWE